MSDSRPDWDTYFLGIAEAVSRRADCSRRQVGALVVVRNRIVSSGYNGAPSGAVGCLSGGCPRAFSDVDHGSSYDTGPGTCIAIHAEANALLYAGRQETEGATLYVTSDVCLGCMRLVRAAAIERLVTPYVALDGLVERPLGPVAETWIAGPQNRT